jgi:hypothetical protein
MGQFLSGHSSEILTFIGGLFTGGVGGSLLTLHIKREKRVSGRGSMADQGGASAGGDIVGRDKVSSPRR